MPSVFGRQQDGFPLAESRRTAADVDGDVPDLAIEHGHVFALRLRPLVVQAAQHAACRRGNVALHEIWRQPVRSELVIVERFEERSEEHTSELQSLMRNSYAVFCLKKKNSYLY